MSKNIKLAHYEDYKIFDTLANQVQNCHKRAAPVGWVRAYLHKDPKKLGKPFYDGPNLIVAKGREFVAQKLFQLKWINFKFHYVIFK